MNKLIKQQTSAPISKQYRNPNFSEFDHRTTDYSNSDMYINLNIFNPAGTGGLIPAIYNEQRTQSLFPNPKDWKCAVVSLYCPSTQLPLFMWNDFLPDGITATYTLSLAVKNYNGIAPDISVTQQVFFTPYNDTNFVYIFNQLILSVNTAFAAAFTSLVFAYNSTQGPNAWQTNVNLPQTPPILYYNSDDSLFTLAVPFLYNAQPTVSNPINPSASKPFVQISMNFRLYRFFDNWPSIVNTNPNVGNDIVLKVYNTGQPQWLGFSNNYYPSFPPLPTTLLPNAQWQYNIKQQNATTAIISNIKAIVIRSTMPLRYEYTNVINSQTGSLGAVGILSDFSISITSSESEQSLIYSPLPQYHWIDILSDTEFTLLNYSLEFVDQADNFYPVMLAENETCSMKILFSLK